MLSTKVQSRNISYSKYSFVNPFKIFWISFVQFYFCKGSFILWELSLFCIEHKSFVHLTQPLPSSHFKIATPCSTKKFCQPQILLQWQFLRAPNNKSSAPLMAQFIWSQPQQWPTHHPFLPFTIIC